MLFWRSWNSIFSLIHLRDSWRMQQLFNFQAHSNKSVVNWRPNILWVWLTVGRNSPSCSVLGCWGWGWLSTGTQPAWGWMLVEVVGGLRTLSQRTELTLWTPSKMQGPHGHCFSTTSQMRASLSKAALWAGEGVYMYSVHPSPVKTPSSLTLHGKWPLFHFQNKKFG